MKTEWGGAEEWKRITPNWHKTKSTSAEDRLTNQMVVFSKDTKHLTKNRKTDTNILLKNLRSYFKVQLKEKSPPCILLYHPL